MNVRKRFLSYLLPQILETVNSKYNGEIEVRISFGQVSISAGGLMQSGKFLEQTWTKAFNTFFSQTTRKPDLPAACLPAGRARQVTRILILGLGAGSIAHVLSTLFPTAKITGVDIDPVIVDLGKKYFKLDKVKDLAITISDASEFVRKERKSKNSYDLIFVDLYHGYDIPSVFQTDTFLKQLNQLLSRNGVVVFNLLTTKMQNPEAKSFLDKITKIYHDEYISNVYANTVVFARK